MAMLNSQMVNLFKTAPTRDVRFRAGSGRARPGSCRWRACKASECRWHQASERCQRWKLFQESTGKNWRSMAKMSPQKNIRTLRLSELLTEIRPTSENQSKPTKLRHPPLPFGSLWRFFQFLQPGHERPGAPPSIRARPWRWRHHRGYNLQSWCSWNSWASVAEGGVCKMSYAGSLPITSRMAMSSTVGR